MADVSEQEATKVMEGLSALCSDDEIVTRWIAFVEVIDKDGKRDIRANNSEGWLMFEMEGVYWNALNGAFVFDDEEDEEV